MLWASAHGLVMLRLSGIVADDTELRQLHERTMSALVRGARQTMAGSRGTSAPKLISPAPARKAARKPPEPQPTEATMHNLLNPNATTTMHNPSKPLRAVAVAAALILSCLGLPGAGSAVRRRRPPIP